MKKVKITTIILAIILVTLIAFAGIYTKTQNRMENKVKGYTLSKELDGKRIIDIKVKSEDTSSDASTSETEGTDTSTEKQTTQESNSDKLTVENYKIVKQTIEKRLKKLKAQDYNVSLNEENGTIRVELPENDETDTLAYYLTANSEVVIKDKDTSEEIISDSMIKSAKYEYNSNMNGEYQVYLNIELTKEGQAKLEEATANYAFLESEITEIEDANKSTDSSTKDGTTAESTENAEATTENSEINNEEQKADTKKVTTLTFAGTEYKIDKIDKNKLTVKIGSKTTNNTSINNNMAKAAEISMLIDAGKYPIEYEVENNRYVYSDISKQQIIGFSLVMLALLLVVLIAISIKYKGKGLLCAISFIGFISVFSLLLRYTNVLISIEGIGAIILTILINLKINKSILEKTQNMHMLKEAYTATYKEQFWRIIPIMIIAVTFCFSGWTNLSSFGLIMFWGIILIPLYNIIVTQTLLNIEENE